MYQRRFLSSVITLLWLLGLRFGGQTPAEKESALRSLLRRFPFWARGHRDLAMHALESDQVSLAYSSALSYQMLSGSNEAGKAQALSLLGRCFLKRGDPQTALSNFYKAKELGLNTARLEEDIAAAHILMGSYTEAHDTLAAIPATVISAEGKAALAFVKGKVTAPLAAH